MTVTSCPTVVPGMFVVGCHGDGHCRHYPGSWGEEEAPPPTPTVGGGGWGDLPRGLFQAECVWSLMPQAPQGPPGFCLWEGVTVLGDWDHICVSLTGQTLSPPAWAWLPGPDASSCLSLLLELSPILRSHGNGLSQGVSVASWGPSCSGVGLWAGFLVVCVWGWWEVVPPSHTGCTSFS